MYKIKNRINYLKYKFKKIFFNLILIPFYIPASIIFILIYFLKKKKKIRFFQLSPRLGFDLPYLDFYFLHEKDENLYLDVFFYYNIPSNLFLKQLIKQRVLLLSKYICLPIKNIEYAYSLLFKKKISFLLKKLSYGNRDIFGSLDLKISSFKLSQSNNLHGHKILEKMGLKENSKFICLNVRDSLFLEKNIFKINMDYHSYRDSDIDDYLKCCDRLTQLGYYVIRVGVITKKPIKTNNDMIIDYSHSKFRSDFMDFFLGSNCEFCISTGSGFDSIPFVFRKPILYVNIAPVGLLNASSKKFMFLPKHHYCNIKKRNLNLKEIFQNNAGMALKTNDFKDNNISLKNNNPDEILNASLDMINLIKNDFIISEAQIRNVNKFSYILNKYIPKDKYINIHGKIKSSFSFSFLDTNNTYLD